MFCNNCGAQMPDDTRFCTSCGTAVGDPAESTTAADFVVDTAQNIPNGDYAPIQGYQPNQAYNANQVGNPAGNFSFAGLRNSASSFMSSEKSAKIINTLKQPKTVGIIAVAAAAALTLIILAACGVFKPGYEKVVGSYLDCYLSCDGEDFYDIVAPFCNDLQKEQFWCDSKSELCDEYAERLEDDYRDEFEEECGRNLKISYEIKKVEKPSDKELRELKEELEEYCDYYSDGVVEVKTGKITDARNVKVRYTVTGRDDDYKNTIELLCVKYDGKWYVVTKHYSIDW